MSAIDVIPKLWIVAPVASILGLFVAKSLYNWVKAQDPGTDRQQEIAKHVQDGAMAYLGRQYRAIAKFFVIGVIGFGILHHFKLIEHWAVIAAFVTGGGFSALAGYFGMLTATTASNRTAAAAQKSLNDGLQVAFKGGAVMGIVVVSLALLDNSIWLFALQSIETSLPPQQIANIMVSCGMGASLMALFARVGGGIYTKAADVGADLVGKVEAGIPEDDPRNPATIADNVGDNVGDVAGMGADLYESYYGSIVAAAGLGATAMAAAGWGADRVIRIATFPAIIAGFGILLSLICLKLVKTQDGAGQKELFHALHKGVNGAAYGIMVVAFILCYGHKIAAWTGIGFFNELAVGSYLPEGVHILGSIITGLVAGMLIGKITEYYTSAEYKPTRELSAQSETGPATIIIGGMALGMRSTALPVLVVAVAILAAYGFAGGFNQDLASNVLFGLFGVAISAVGMLSTLGLTLATDAYGPIADNAGGNAEMAGLDPIVRERTDALDALGNTTAATGKGFAIGSAALTALAFVAAFTMSLRNVLADWAAEAPEALSTAYRSFEGLSAEAVHAMSLSNILDAVGVSMMNPNFIVGAFIGAMVVFLFSAMTMEAVGRAAMDMVQEVRRQFREIAGIMEEKATPDYRRCVDISTAGALREMKAPAMLAFLTPIATGLVLGIPGVMGLLLGGLTSGFLFAILMANAGGAWDNAKKFVESGEFKDSTGTVQKKGSDNHKATIVGDTVGDPFKDTSGPALNILIKLMSVVSVVFLAVTVKISPAIMAFLGIAS